MGTAVGGAHALFHGLVRPRCPSACCVPSSTTLPPAGNRAGRTYFINSQRDTVYYRPQTITASRRFARRPPLSDYEFTRRSVRTTPAPGLISDIVV
jgi:hypothetical protein